MRYFPISRLPILILTLATAGVYAQPVASVQITRTPNGKVVPRDFMGLSFQQSAALQFFGPSTGSNTVLFTLMKNLGSGSLRIGGAAADLACWNGEPAPVPYLCQYTLTSADFNSWTYASGQTGWPMIVGLNLVQNASPGAPQYIFDEVVNGLLPALASHPRASLTALELGNEINLYYLNPAYRPSTYSVNDQTNDLLSYISVLKANSATQNIALAAPAYYNPTVSTVTSQLDPLLSSVLTCGGCNAANLGIVTLHEYPLNLSKGIPTIDQLLSASLIQRIEQIFQKAVSDVRTLYKLNVQIDETNSTIPDPGQPGVSDVQASALWALDYALDMARIGVRRINFHIHDGSYYDPVVIASNAGVFTNQVRPQYYGMYAFNAAKGNQFLPVTVTTSANIRAYALSACATCAITVYIVNKDSAAFGTVQISLSTPAASATYFELSAPSLGSFAQDVTYGGVQFNNATGLLTGAVQTIPIQPDASGNYTVTLDNAAAGILTIQP